MNEENSKPGIRPVERKFAAMAGSEAHIRKIEEGQMYYLFFDCIKIHLDERRYLFTAVLHNKTGMWQRSDGIKPFVR